MRVLETVFGDDAAILRELRFQLLLFATVFPILGTALVSPILDSLIEPFGASPGNIGLMISFLTAPAIVVIPFSGMLADRYGRKPVLVVALLCFGAGGSAISLTTEFRIVLALRALQGIGFGGIVPVITASIGDMYEGQQEITGQGLRLMANGISGAIVPLVSGALVVMGWQYPFLLYGMAFPAAAVVHLWFAEPTADADTKPDGTGKPAYHRALFWFVRHPRVLSLLIARTVSIVAWIGFLTYNSLIVARVMGGTAFQAGLLVAIGNFAFAGGASQIGRVVSLFRGKFYAFLVANLLLVVGFVEFFFAPRVSLAVPGIGVAGVGFGVLFSASRSYLTELAPETLRAGIVSLGAAGARVTATLTPIVMGFVINIATPVLGEAVSLQMAGVGSVVFTGVGGILCLLVASVSDPAPTDLEDVIRT